MSEEGGVHPECRNASNPFHLCTNYCFIFISEANKGLNATPGPVQEAMKAVQALQTDTVQEKKIMEPPEEMAHDKQPAPAGQDGEKFVNDFLTAFPPLTYLGDKVGEEIYAPPIPVNADINAPINTEDVSKVGAYPDHVVLSIANERDKLKAQLQQVIEETTKQKMLYQNEHRQAELWRAKYYAVANAPAHGPASHGQDSGVEE